MLPPVATTALPAARVALAMSTPIPRPAPVINHTFFPLVGPSRRACKDVSGRRSACLSDIPSLPSLVTLLSTIKAQIACKQALNERSCCKPQRSHVLRRHFGSYSFRVSTQARPEEIELVAERIFWYESATESSLQWSIECSQQETPAVLLCYS